MDGWRVRCYGDYFCIFLNGYYVVGGWVDDIMNLGGIKVSLVEIECVFNFFLCVKEIVVIVILGNDGGFS